MAKFKKVKDGYIRFECPGCKRPHVLSVDKGADRKSYAWGFNGNYDKPTLEPSVLMKSGHYCDGQQGKDCWCSYEARFGEKPPFDCVVCHSFVRDGRIEFLNDCTHALAGKTVELEEIKDA